MPTLLAISFLLSLLLCAFFVVWRRLTRPEGLPPGPPGHWLWGNDFPQQDEFLQYDEWAKQYGPVYLLRSWSEIVVVIGGMQAASDILEKEGLATADRPRKVAAGEILSGGMRILLTRFGDQRLNKLRRAFHVNITPQTAASYEETQYLNARQLVCDILDEPSKFFEHTSRYAASTSLGLAYGKASPGHKGDTDVELMGECLYNLGRALRPGVWLVDYMPWMKHLPFYARTLRQQHQLELELFLRQMQGVRDDMTTGRALPSFGRYLVESQEELALSDVEVAYLAGSMFGGASDTTVAGLRVIILAAALFPEIQREVQAEMDVAIGREHLPTFADIERLPRLRAFVLETFRWRPGAAAGIQHCTTKAISWGGFTIPAGATLIPNHWSIGRDKDVFPDGDAFKPDRWLRPDGRLVEDVAFPNFGFGRRSCPGRLIAERSMNINAALLLHAFHISQDSGHPMRPLEFKHGLSTYPSHFVASFRPRYPDGERGLKSLLGEL